MPWLSLYWCLALISTDNEREQTAQLLHCCLCRCPFDVRFAYATIKIRNERDCKLKRLKEIYTYERCVCGVFVCFPFACNGLSNDQVSECARLWNTHAKVKKGKTILTAIAFLLFFDYLFINKAFVFLSEKSEKRDWTGNTELPID